MRRAGSLWGIAQAAIDEGSIAQMFYLVKSECNRYTIKWQEAARA